MATGFTQRFKGKINIGASGLWVHGRSIYGNASTQRLPLMCSSLGYSSANASIVTLLTSASTTQGIVKIAAPPFPNYKMLFQVSTLNAGGGIILMASTDGSIGFNGSTLSVAKSSGTTAQVLELVATSSNNWAIIGEYPFSSTGLWTLSTSS